MNGVRHIVDAEHHFCLENDLPRKHTEYGKEILILLHGTSVCLVNCVNERIVLCESVKATCY